jgi:hypothetical protein
VERDASSGTPEVECLLCAAFASPRWRLLMGALAWVVLSAHLSVGETLKKRGGCPPWRGVWEGVLVVCVAVTEHRRAYELAVKLAMRSVY